MRGNAECFPTRPHFHQKQRVPLLASNANSEDLNKIRSVTVGVANGLNLRTRWDVRNLKHAMLNGATFWTDLQYLINNIKSITGEGEEDAENKDDKNKVNPYKSTMYGAYKYEAEADEQAHQADKEVDDDAHSARSARRHIAERGHKGRAPRSRSETLNPSSKPLAQPSEQTQAKSSSIQTQRHTLTPIKHHQP